MQALLHVYDCVCFMIVCLCVYVCEGVCVCVCVCVIVCLWANAISASLLPPTSFLNTKVGKNGNE